jgi:predicted SprT family Zn-dependent metalloprotease
MKIPKKFKLFGQEITVNYRADLEDATGNTGEARLKTNEITLQDFKTNKRPKSQQEQAFWHEVLHFIMWEFGYEQQLEKLNIDTEQMVNNIANGIHQILVTSVNDSN